MLAAPAAGSSDSDAAGAAATLIGRAGAGANAAEWLDTDAWIVLQERAGIARLLESYGDDAEILRLRTLARDAGERSRRAAAAVPTVAIRAASCTPTGPGERWAAAAPAPELLAWWPGRPALRAVALVPLRCPAEVDVVAAGLTLGPEAGWRLVGFATTETLAQWRAFGEWVTHDVPAERARARAKLLTTPAPVVEQWAPPAFASRPAGPPGDLDGDGLPDLLVETNEVYWSGRGVVSPTVGGAIVRAGGDIDGDGRADLLAKERAGAWVWPAGDAASARPLTNPLGHASDWSLADVDGDGRTDVVALSVGVLCVWFAGAAEPTARLTVTPEARSIGVAGDLDGDGTDDLVFTPAPHGVHTGLVQIVFGARQGARPRTGAFAEDPGRAMTWHLLPGDVDGDGTAELYAGHTDPVGGGYMLDVYRGDGEVVVRDLAAEVRGPDCRVRGVADLAGDRRSEVVAVCGNELGVWSPETAQVTRTTLPLRAQVQLAVVGGAGERAVTVSTAEELRVLHAPAWRWEEAVSVAKPSTAAQFSRLPPAPAPLRALEVALPPSSTCEGRLTLDAAGRATALTYSACPGAVQQRVLEAVMAAQWPNQGARGALYRLSLQGG